ncbi:MAG: STAS domain-containing protein [Dongiaceae bacterium]
MNCSERRVGGSIILAPTGRLELTNAEACKEILLRAVGGAERAVILDLAQLEYISSAGLRSLMIAVKSAKAKSVGVGIAAMQPVVREIFKISRFDLVFPCFETVAAALEKLAPADLPALGSPG